MRDFKSPSLFENLKTNKHGLFKIILAWILIKGTIASIVQMRIVTELATYGQFGHNVGDYNDHNDLLLSVEPANFSGPELLQKLVGNCYNLTDKNYNYKFCPFQNFTQHELSSTWNAYHGVLGVWSHWKIENNTFSSTVFKHGDTCGDIERSVEVHFECGKKERLLNVSEPGRCRYWARFSSRYVCHPDAMLVYPRLNESLRRQWDSLLTDYDNSYFTEKGFKEELQSLFERAGFGEPKPMRADDNSTPASPKEESNGFNNLLSCNREFKSLQREISHMKRELGALQLLLQTNSLKNNTLDR